MRRALGIVALAAAVAGCDPQSRSSGVRISDQTYASTDCKAVAIFLERSASAHLIFRRADEKKYWVAQQPINAGHTALTQMNDANPKWDTTSAVSGLQAVFARASFSDGVEMAGSKATRDRIREVANEYESRCDNRAVLDLLEAAL